MSKQRIEHGKHYAIGTTRAWWYDHDDSWQVRISMNKQLGRLCVSAGPVSYEYPSDACGMWGDDDKPTNWSCEGYGLHALASFLEFIVGVVGDGDRLRQAFGHLMRCQYNEAEIFQAGSVCSNQGAVIHRWQWDNVPPVETVSVDDIGK
jgi:hypothetical protein